MASLIVGAGLLIHGKIKDDRNKRKEKKRKRYEDRYNELEKEHKSHEAQYLQRKATGESELVGAPAAGHSPPEDSLRRRSSQESLGSQRGVDDQDGPAKWVERAMSERQQPVRQ